jgi:hypothetical protein
MHKYHKNADFFAKAHFREKSRCAPQSHAQQGFGGYSSYSRRGSAPRRAPPAKIWTARIFQLFDKLKNAGANRRLHF